jgi:HSP20 family protein
MGMLLKRRDAFPSVFGNLFEDFFRDDVLLPAMVGNSVPAVNISEEKDKYQIEVAVPGMEKKDFKLDLDNNILTISCEKETQESKKEQKYTRKEFSFTSFQRSFTLPEGVDIEKVDAAYKDGLLVVHLPKTNVAQAKPVKSIKIS